jgi:hypothetical protein
MARLLLEDGHLKFEGDENTMDLDEALRHLGEGHECRHQSRAENSPEVIQRLVTHHGRPNVARA